MQSMEDRSDVVGPRRLSRRAALGIGVAGVAGASMAVSAATYVIAADGTPPAAPSLAVDPHAAHSGTAVSTANPGPAAPPFVPVSGQPLADPPRISGSAGLLETTMTMAVSPTMFAGQGSERGAKRQLPRADHHAQPGGYLEKQGRQSIAGLHQRAYAPIPRFTKGQFGQRLHAHRSGGDVRLRVPHS